MEEYEEIELMQNLLQTEIIEKKYNKVEFINYCLTKKENGDDLNNWTLEELKTIVSEFQLQDNYKYRLKIIIQQTGYLDKKNFYLIFYFRDLSEKIKYNKYCPYEINWKIIEKNFSTIYNGTINVCIYESGIIKNKFLGDFNIELSDLKNKNEFSQKCEISLESKKKGVYTLAVVSIEKPIESESNNLNKKPINKSSQIKNPPLNEKKPLNNNNKDENKKVIEELKKEINNLKKLLEEKDKTINEEKNKVQKLNEKILELQNLLKEKEKIIEEKKNLNQNLNLKIMDLQNIIKDKEEELNQEKKKLEDSNKTINNYKNIMGCDSKDEKVIKLLNDLESKEKEIKRLNEIKSRFPFELLEKEK